MIFEYLCKSVEMCKATLSALVFIICTVTLISIITHPPHTGHIIYNNRNDNNNADD